MSASRHLLFLLRLAFISFLLSRGSSALQLTCPRSDVAGVVDSIRSPKCPIWIERSFPEEVDGDTLDKALAHVQEGAFYSVYFYASKCPFSQSFKPTFDSLSSMFPKIRHLAVEKSFAMPSFFSRYRIHGFPTLLLSTKTERIIYGGSKDLDSLICFYKKVTGQNEVNEPGTCPKKIAAGVRQGCKRQRGILIVQESCLLEWQNIIAESSKKGYAGEIELQWDSHKIMDQQLKQDWIQSIEKRKSMPESQEVRELLNLWSSGEKSRRLSLQNGLILLHRDTPLDEPGVVFSGDDSTAG